MIGRILLFPFWVVKKILGLVFGIIGFAARRAPWIAVGGLAGYLLGKKYLEKKSQEN